MLKAWDFTYFSYQEWKIKKSIYTFELIKVFDNYSMTHEKVFLASAAHIYQRIIK